MSENLTELFRRARKNKARAVIEGFHALKHALRFGAGVTHVYASSPSEVLNMARSFAPDTEALIKKHMQEVPEEIFKELPRHSFHTGVIAIAKRPDAEMKKDGHIVYLENPRDLWNIGAVVRVAAAAGASGVVTTGTADPWDAASVVASVGLHFAVPVRHTSKSPHDFGLTVAVFDSEEGSESVRELPTDCVLVFGEERRGVSGDLKSSADRLVRIPMQEGVSSLNLATSVAVALYAF